jgi:hypothetical protein
VKRVLALAETKAWSNSHPFPVVVMPEIDKKQGLGGRCYWSVTVYASRPERMELWHVFFAELEGDRILISDSNGAVVTLDHWRRKPR